MIYSDLAFHRPFFRGRDGEIGCLARFCSRSSGIRERRAPDYATKQWPAEPCCFLELIRPWRPPSNRLYLKMESATVYILLVVFVATLVRSAFGFGEALLAVPLLVLRIPLQVAAPLAVLISITIAGCIVAQDWRHVHFKSAGWLVFATLFGIPLGLLLLTSSHQEAVKLTLAIVIICFAVLSLVGNPPELHSDSKTWLMGCGFVAGILGGAYGMNGPPLAVYGSMRRWSAQHFRATLQGYFLPASLLGMLGYWWQGLWVPSVTHYYLVSLPVIIPPIWAGRIVNRRLPVDHFRKYIYLGLIIIGSILAIQ
jgi:uncharacterized protein